MHKAVQHRIDVQGVKINCFAPADAYCRRRPQCDTGTWHDQLCDDHSPGHAVLSGQDCWMVEWPNAWTLEDSCEGFDPIIKGAPVVLTYLGNDIGVTWRLAMRPQPAWLPEV